MAAAHPISAPRRALTPVRRHHQDSAAGPALRAQEERGGKPMTAARIIEAIGSLLWPLLLAVVVFRVLPHLPGTVADLRQALRTRAFKVKVGGVELSVEQATEQLRRQVTDLQTQVAAQLAERGPAAAAAAAAAAQPYQGRPTVPWVDDRPEGNALELAKLRDDGVEVLQARSTAEAMDVLTLRRGVQAVITDLGRGEGGEYRPHAGLELLRQLREAGFELPVLVYTSARGVARDREDAVAAGAALVTASPTELFAALRELLRPAEPAAAAAPAGPPGNHRPSRPARQG
jgi:CheY-like chemotaxis protein